MTVSLATAAGRSSRYSALNPSVGSLARGLHPAWVMSVWPSWPSSRPSSVITSSLAVVVAPVVETVAVGWLTPAEKLPVRSSGDAAATLRHSDHWGVLSIVAGLILKVGFVIPPGLLG